MKNTKHLQLRSKYKAIKNSEIEKILEAITGLNKKYEYNY